jgi:hypothetical protein
MTGNRPYGRNRFSPDGTKVPEVDSSADYDGYHARTISLSG